MACGCTSTCSGTCNNCNTCVTICPESWTITSTVTSLNPCITPSYCTTACAETISTDCVMLSSNIVSTINCIGTTLLAGATLTQMLNYLFCPDDYVLSAVFLQNCATGTDGTITVSIDLLTWTLTLVNSLGVTLQTLETADGKAFSGVVAGTYTIALNGFVSIPIVVTTDGLISC